MNTWHQLLQQWTLDLLAQKSPATKAYEPTGKTSLFANSNNLPKK